MNYTQHPEYRAMLRAIRANPADDLPRLILADWLDERAGSCPNCKGDRWFNITKQFLESSIGKFAKRGVFISKDCPTCHGTGTNGAAERAEFIRVQIANSKDAKPDDRDMSLWNRWRTNWNPCANVILSYDVHRGFIAAVRCTLAQFDEHAGRIAAEHPVTRWVLTDREPYRPIGDSVLMDRDDAINGYWWLLPTLRALPSDLPRHILESMKDDWDGVSSSAKGFNTREAAIEALNAACVRIANERADALESQA